MTAWEYCTAKIVGAGDPATALNELGEQGWELVHLQPIIEKQTAVFDPAKQPTLALMCIFKRQRQPKLNVPPPVKP